MTADPRPPTRTWMLTPPLSIVSMRKSKGKGGTCAAAGVAQAKSATSASRNIAQILGFRRAAGFPLLTSGEFQRQAPPPSHKRPWPLQYLPRKPEIGDQDPSD